VELNISASFVRVSVVSVFAAAASAMGLASAYADSASPPEIPTCIKKIGTLAVTEPQNQWWTAMQLESPASLIKVYVAQSKCFTLVDRGKGLDAAKAERQLAASGEERVGSNIGKGQMKAADYVLVPDIANRNGNSGGKNIGAHHYHRHVHIAHGKGHTHTHGQIPDFHFRAIRACPRIKTWVLPYRTG